MNIESLRAACRALPGAAEDVKWDNQLVFSVGGRMFVMACLDRPHEVSFKVPDEEFDELAASDGIRPAPYLARARWIQVEALSGVVPDSELRQHVARSYDLVKSRLPKKTQAALAGAGRRRDRPKRVSR
jgi:predicted DNA-binding protein (MmcQ/YjbR family)